MFLDFLFPKEAEAGTITPAIAQRFGSRYIEALKRSLPGFPKTATGGEILPKLEAGGVLPTGFGEAYLRDPNVPRDLLVRHLEENWMKPKLYFFGGGALPEGSIGTVATKIPVGEDIKFGLRQPVNFDEAPVPFLSMYRGSGFATLYTPEDIAAVLGVERTRDMYRKLIEPLTYLRTLSKLTEGVAPSVPGAEIRVHYAPVFGLGATPRLTGMGDIARALEVAREFTETDVFKRRARLAKEVDDYIYKLFKRYRQEAMSELPKEAVVSQKASVSSSYPILEHLEVPYTGKRPPATKYGYMQFIDRSGEPFELALSPGWSGGSPPATHLKMGDFVHIRGTKTGDALHVQEIQSDWVRHMKDPRFPKPPPEAVKKWPEHGVEITLSYASRLPDVNKVVIFDEPAIAATRGRETGTYQGYDKALKYAEKRAKELGLKVERVPLKKLYPNAPEDMTKGSNPLVIYLTDKAKEAIKTGTALLGASGLMLDWETGQWRLQPQPQQQQKQKVPEPGNWLMRLFGVGG